MLILLYHPDEQLIMVYSVLRPYWVWSSAHPWCNARQ